MGKYKSDILYLLPKKKEFEITVENISDFDNISVDVTDLYENTKYVRRAWKTYIAVSESNVYILTGTAQIKTVNLCGNVYFIKNKAKIASLYVNIPFYYASLPYDDRSEKSEIKAEAFIKNKYRLKSKDKYCISGVIKFDYSQR